MRSWWNSFDRITKNIFTALGLLLLPICIGLYYVLDAPTFFLYVGIFGFLIVLPETPVLFRDIKHAIVNSSK